MTATPQTTYERPAIPHRPGGWWHNFACPVHGAELLAGESTSETQTFRCPAGCEVSGEPYSGAWTVMCHQQAARRIRLAGHRGDAAHVFEALAQYRALLDTVGNKPNEDAEHWMVRGRLFHQALTEAIWGVAVADGIWALCEQLPDLDWGPAEDDARGLLAAILETVRAGRAELIDAGKLKSNYTAWLTAAERLASGALAALDGDLDTRGDLMTGPVGLARHLQAAILPDGWEWEGAPYYHMFVLRASLLSLRGWSAAEIPEETQQTLRAMIGALTAISTADGTVPAIHDSPVARRAQDLEYLETMELAGQLFPDLVAQTAAIRDAAAARLGSEARETVAMIRGWIGGAGYGVAGRSESGPGTQTGAAAGPAEPAQPEDAVGLSVFPDAGFGIVRQGGTGFSAILDFGPHGGSHGHFDKLALYFYGRGVWWQPDPGAPPYGSFLRYPYAGVRSHPTVRIGNGEQAECSGKLLDTRMDGGTAFLAAETRGAYPGVLLRRRVIMAPDHLIDIFDVEADHGADTPSGEISLGFRPDVDFAVRPVPGDPLQWRSTWGEGSELLFGTHLLPHTPQGPFGLRSVPVRAPADRPHLWRSGADWTLDAGLAGNPLTRFASLYSAADPAAGLDVQDGRIIVTVSGRTYTYTAH